MMVRMKYILFVWQIAALSGKSMSDITPVPDFSALEGYDATFGWKFPLPFDRLEWYKGDASGNVIMDQTAGSTNKYVNYIDYITGTNSVGMVLKNVTTGMAGLYTVKVVPSSGPTETSSTELTILSNGQYDACQSNISVKVNGKVVLESMALQPGNLDITVSMLCDLNKTITVTCTKTSSNDHVNCGNCTGITCVLDTIDAAANDKIALVIIPVLWQGPSFNFNISVAADATTSLDSSTTGILTFSSTPSTVLTRSSPTFGNNNITVNKLTTFSESITVANDKKNPATNIGDTEHKPALWQTMLIIGGGVLFIMVFVVIVITCLHRTDKKYSRARYNRSKQHRTHSQRKEHLPDQHVGTPQHRFYGKYYNSARFNDYQQDTRAVVPQLVSKSPYRADPRYNHRFRDPDLLVAEGPESFIDIANKRNNMKYPFSNITTKYTGSYANSNVPNEPRPDYSL